MLKLISFAVIATCFFTLTWGQTTSNSPFSSYGLGEYGGIYGAQFAGIGNITAISTDTTVLNPYNPSTYALLSHGQPLFGLGLTTKMSFFSSNGANQKSYNTNITNFTFAVPFGKRFGLGGGLVPYTRRGYDISTRSYAYDDSITHQYTGSGSINNGFVGFSYAPIKTNRTELSLGIQASFLFGNVANNRYSYYDDAQNYDGVQITKKRVKSFSYNLGLTFRQYLDYNRKKEIVFGAIFTPQINLKGNLDYGLYYCLDVSNYATYDTLIDITDQNGTITMPTRQVYSVGYSTKPDNTENIFNSIYCLGIYGEFELMNWKAYRENFDGYTSPNLNNTISLRFGLQFQPNVDIQTKTKSLGYFKKIKYRVGGFYGQNPLYYNGSQITTTGFSFGMGLPFLIQKSNSSLNFSLQYGSTSNHNAGDLSEKFLSFNIGIIIAPSIYERWFRKYKLD